MTGLRTGLVFLGVVAFLLGVAAAVFASPLETTIPQAQIAEYVGSDTCFTCHEKPHREWEGKMHPMPIQTDSSENAVLNAAMALEEDQARARNFGGETHAYTSADVPALMGADQYQGYMLKTPDGLLTLPGQWKATEQQWIKADQHNWLTSCAGCHSAEANASTVLNGQDVTCETCHGPGADHVAEAEALEVVESPQDELQVRRALHYTIDMNVCGQCHVSNVPDAPDATECPVYVIAALIEPVSLE